MPGPRQNSPAPLHADVGALREHRVEVRRNHKLWPRQDTRAIAEDIARLVEADVGQAQLLEGGFHGLAAGGFLERRRRNFAEADLIGDDLRLVGPDAVKRRAGRSIHRLGTDASRRKRSRRMS